MISMEDCLALCGLTEAEVAAIAEHEHVPEIAAAILGQYLLRADRQDGLERLRQMIVDDIRVALGNGDRVHAAELSGALRHLMSTTPAREKA